jgi:sigma-B regulation protein RsbU (phosphoserine phosphatase)
VAAGTQDVWTVVCVALVGAITVLDVVVGSGLEAALVVGPVVASAKLSPHRTAVIAALAVGCGVTVAGIEGRFGHLDTFLRVVAAIVIATVCLAVALDRQRREQRLSRLIEVAEIAQHAILPPIPIQVGHVDIATRYLSAAEDALVGGDLYDVVETADRVRLIVGDVRGKGLDAIRLAVVVLGLFRRAATAETDLDGVAKAVDSALGAYLEDEDFVTAVFVDFTAEGVSIVNCGHHPPLRLGSRGGTELDSSERSLPLGLGPNFTIDTYPLDRGDRILVYTDGLIEARNPAGAFFGLDQLPSQFLMSAPLEDTLDAVVKRLLAHVGGHLNDDMALVLAQPFVKPQPSGAAPPPASPGDH